VEAAAAPGAPTCCRGSGGCSGGDGRRHSGACIKENPPRRDEKGRAILPPGKQQRGGPTKLIPDFTSRLPLPDDDGSLMHDSNDKPSEMVRDDDKPSEMEQLKALHTRLVAAVRRPPTRFLPRALCCCCRYLAYDVVLLYGAPQVNAGQTRVAYGLLQVPPPCAPRLARATPVRCVWSYLRTHHGLSDHE
jgi:hypothetical protein